MYKNWEVVWLYKILDGWKDKWNIKYSVECTNCWKKKDVFYNSLKSCRHCKPRSRKTKIHDNYIELQLTWWEYTKVDLDVYENIKNYCWYKTERNSVDSRVKNKLIKLHRLILCPNPEDIIDHINWDPLDNRRVNLRICTTQENSFNRRAWKNSKTQIKWVRFDKTKWKYATQITLNWKRTWWGYFNDLQSATDKVNQLTKTLHLEFAKKQYYND